MTHTRGNREGKGRRESIFL